jgi:hypothetical protein
LGIWAYVSNLFDQTKDVPSISFHAITFLALPVIGLYYSLGSRNVLIAFLTTIGVGLLIPVLVPKIFVFLCLPRGVAVNIQTGGASSFLQAVFAVICWFKLHDRLKSRDFPLDRRET